MLIYTWQFEPIFKSNTLFISRDNSYIFLSLWLLTSFWLSHDTFKYILGWSFISDVLKFSVSIVGFCGLLDLSSTLNTLFPGLSSELLKSPNDSQPFYASDIINIALGEKKIAWNEKNYTDIIFQRIKSNLVSTLFVSIFLSLLWKVVASSLLQTFMKINLMLNVMVLSTPESFNLKGWLKYSIFVKIKKK